MAISTSANYFVLVQITNSLLVEVIFEVSVVKHIVLWFFKSVIISLVALHSLFV